MIVQTCLGQVINPTLAGWLIIFTLYSIVMFLHAIILMLSENIIHSSSADGPTSEVKRAFNLNQIAVRALVLLVLFYLRPSKKHDAL